MGLLLLSRGRPLGVVLSREERRGRGSTALWGRMLSRLKVRLEPPSWDIGVKSVSSSPSSSCVEGRSNSLNEWCRPMSGADPKLS